jgi:DNA-directed RNA polymerase sigma subunit (sigma70/sigma32)
MENIEGDESRRDGAGTGAPVLCAKRQELVENNIRLAYSGANRIQRPRWLSFDEWEAECLYVLVKAAAHFDFGLGFAFSTYFFRCLYTFRKNLTVRALADVRDIRRNRALHGENKDGAIMPGREDSHQWIDDEDTRYRLEEIQKKLQANSKIRIVFDMRREGKTFVEIARHFGCTKQNIEALWRKMLRQFAGVECRKSLTRVRPRGKSRLREGTHGD